MDGDAFDAPLVNRARTAILESKAPDVVETKEIAVTTIPEARDKGWYKQRGCNWVFTIFGYTPELLTQMKEAWPLRYPDFKCIMWGEEICPDTKRPHLQGFMCFEQVKSGTQITALKSDCRWARMIKPVINNAIYCKKDQTGIVLVGTLPISNAQKGALGAVMNPWNQMQEAIVKGATKRELMVSYAELWGKFSSGCNLMFDTFKPTGEYDLIKKYGKLLEWQQALLEIALKEPDGRSVYWIYEPIGGKGKTAFIKHLAVNHSFQALTNAQTRDLACAWEGKSICMNFARSEITDWNYDILEKIKDGMMFSPKYQSATKFSAMHKDVHVICFANEPPNVSKLSMDRWKLYEIVDEKLVIRDPKAFVTHLGFNTASIPLNAPKPG